MMDWGQSNAPTDWNEWEAVPAPAPAAPAPAPAAAPGASWFSGLRNTNSPASQLGFGGQIALNDAPAVDTGFVPRLGRALSYLPPVAAAMRGAGNMIRPAMRAAPVAAQWFRDVAAPEAASDLAMVAAPIDAMRNQAIDYYRNVVAPEALREGATIARVAGVGARNIVRPFMPNVDPTALIGGPEGAKAWGQVFNPPVPVPQDNPPAAPIQFPAPPADPRQREVGKIYQTPAGPKRWRGSYWIDV